MSNSDSKKLAIQQLNPESIIIMGLEETTRTYTDKSSFMKNFLEKEVNELDREIRLTAEEQILAAGAKRAFFPNGRRGGQDGVSVTYPDVSKEANRNQLKDDIIKELITHEVSSVIGTMDDLVMTQKEKGGTTVVLKGRMAEWFNTEYIAKGLVKEDDDVVVTEVKPSVVHKLKPEAVTRLQGLLRSPGAEQHAKMLARKFLDAGVKKMSLKIEEGGKK